MHEQSQPRCAYTSPAGSADEIFLLLASSPVENGSHKLRPGFTMEVDVTLVDGSHIVTLSLLIKFW